MTSISRFARLGAFVALALASAPALAIETGAYTGERQVRVQPAPATGARQPLSFLERLDNTFNPDGRLDDAGVPSAQSRGVPVGPLGQRTPSEAALDFSMENANGQS